MLQGRTRWHGGGGPPVQDYYTIRASLLTLSSDAIVQKTHVCVFRSIASSLHSHAIQQRCDPSAPLSTLTSELGQ